MRRSLCWGFCLGWSDLAILELKGYPIYVSSQPSQDPYLGLLDERACQGHSASHCRSALITKFSVSFALSWPTGKPWQCLDSIFHISNVTDTTTLGQLVPVRVGCMHACAASSSAIEARPDLHQAVDCRGDVSVLHRQESQFD